MTSRLNRKIDLRSERNGPAVWTGTLDELWADNEGMTYDEISEIAGLLEQYGEAPYGGGAAATSFITTA